MRKVTQLILEGLFCAALSAPSAQASGNAKGPSTDHPGKLQAPQKPLVYYRLTVDARPAAGSDEAKKAVRICQKKFVEEVVKLVGRNFDDSFIGCFGCSALLSDSSPDPSALNFVFLAEHTEHFQTFGNAWNELQKQKNADSGDIGYPLCKLIIDSEQRQESLCGAPVPQPCNRNPRCGDAYNPSGCSRNPPSGKCMSCSS